jgi:hypothetical protein
MYLADARSASVRQDDGANVLKNPCYIVALHCCSNLFRPGGAEKRNLQTVRNYPYSLPSPVPWMKVQPLALAVLNLLLASRGPNIQMTSHRTLAPKTYHILVRAICARADQARRYFIFPAVFLYKRCKFGQGSCQVRSKRSVDGGLNVR